MFTDKLKADEFELNPCDKCTANKTIDGTQYTITRYVNDVKISHVNKDVVSSMVWNVHSEN